MFRLLLISHICPIILKKLWEQWSLQSIRQMSELLYIVISNVMMKASSYVYYPGISLRSIPRKRITKSKCKYSFKTYLTVTAQFLTKKLPTTYTSTSGREGGSWSDKPLYKETV